MRHQAVAYLSAIQRGGSMAIGERVRNAVAFLCANGAGRFFQYALHWTSEMWHERYFGIDTWEQACPNVDPPLTRNHLM